MRKPHVVFIALSLLWNFYFTSSAIAVCTDATKPCICDGTNTLATLACDGVNLSGPNNQVLFGAFGTLGGELGGTTADIASSNMNPYQNYSFDDDLKYWYDRAVVDYNFGNDFRKGLTLMGVALPSDNIAKNKQQEMLLDPRKTYEDVGMVTTDSNGDLVPDSCTLAQNMEYQLKTARDTFAYDIYYNYPTRVEAISSMRNAVKTLANTYLMIADDFLIKALEFRFSSTVGNALDNKLDDQIKRLNQAQLCYDKGLQSFLYGFGTALGTGEYMSDYYDDAIYSLFNSIVERMSLTLREKSAKQYARSMSSDPILADQARLDSLNTLRQLSTQSFFAATAAASRQATNKTTIGVDRIVIAMDAIRSQSNTYRQGLNPLGFDDRYVPMYSPTPLISVAQTYAALAESAEGALKDNRRGLDSDLTTFRTALNSQTDSYKSQLLSMTNISFSSDDLTYLNSVANAGIDLLGCDTSLPSATFETCLQGKTGGRLQMKYYQIRDKQFQLETVLTRKKQQEEKIDFENAKYDRLLDIENVYDKAVKTSLTNYMNAVIKARKDEYDSHSAARDFSKIVGAVKCAAFVYVAVVGTGGAAAGSMVAMIDNGADKVSDPSGCSSLAGGDGNFDLQNKELQLNVKKEIELQDALKNYHISLNGVQHDESVMNLLHRQVEVEIEVGQAILQLNMAIKDFAHELTEKNNLVGLYVQAYNARNLQLSTLQDTIAENRVLKTQEAINVSTNLRKGIHFAYLASKALEYRDLKPRISVIDLYKVQTSADLKAINAQLDTYDKLCAYGSVKGFQRQLSLAKDILGLTDAYLDATIDPNVTMSEVQKAPLRQQMREREVQSFLSQKLIDVDPSSKVVNLLRFNFATTVFDVPYTYDLNGNRIYETNVKLWYATAPAACDPVTARGIAVQVLSKQTSMYAPQITLTQKGHSTYMNGNQKIVEYSPVSKYFNLSFDPNEVADVHANDPELIKSDTFMAIRPPDTNPNTSSQPFIWTPAFKNRSFASSDWEMVVIDDPGAPSTKIDWSKVTDVVVYMDSLSFK